MCGASLRSRARPRLSHPVPFSSYPPTYRQQSAEINKYARGEVDWLDVSEAKRWNALGVLSMVLGLVSAAFALLLGDLFGTGEDEDDKDK